jgi:hypothetical protein
MQQKLLNIYLNDHLAGAAAGLEVARRCRSSNQGTALADFLTGLIAEIDADRTELESIMDKVGASQDRLKLAAAWTAEKAGRLKLNGQLTGYSPLSRLIELEGLKLGITGKKSLWESLKRIEDMDSRLATTDLDLLIKRADEQLEALEPHRLEAAATAFA